MHKLKTTISGATVLTCFFILAALFVWLFLMNFYFSSSYDLLFLKDFDDFNFHRTLELQRSYYRSGGWPNILATTDFAYGNIFWNLLALLTWPAEALGANAWVMVIPRQVSLLAYVFCFIIFYKIGRERQYAKMNISLSLLLLASCSAGIAASTRFHNYTILAALMLWAFYFLLRQRPKAMVGEVIFGIALGIKLTCFLGAPIFFFLLNKDMALDRKSLFSKQFFSRNILAVMTIAAVSILTFSPAIVLLPFGIKSFYLSQEVLTFIVLLHSGFNSNIAGLVEHVQSHLFSSYYHWSLFLEGIVLSFWFIGQSPSKSSDSKIISGLALIAIFMIAVAVKMTERDVLVFAAYILPIVFIFSLIFLELAHHYKKWGAVIMSLLVCLNMTLNFDQWYLEVTGPYTSANSEYVKRKTRQFELLGEKVKLRPTDLVLIDYPLVFPFGEPKSKTKVDYLYGKDYLAGEHSVFIFFKVRSNAKESCLGQSAAESPAESSDCALRRQILASEPPYQVLFEDEEIKVVRKE